MKQALIYLRVSTNEQANRGSEPDGFSIPAQRRACLRIAKDLGVTAHTEFVDRGESARTAQRPGLKTLMQALIIHRPAYVIVHKVDRLARNLQDDVAIRLNIRQAGAELVSATENIDNTPAGQLLHNMLAGMNEFYSANLAAEALKGATEKVRQGGTPFRAPTGYRNVIHRYDDREHRTVQLIQASRRKGERRYLHQHPLKSTLRCGRCGNYLTFSRAKQRYGYFFCRTRHATHSCDLPYLPTALIEQTVARSFEQLQLTPGQRNHLVTTVKRELAISGHHSSEQLKAQAARRARLEREQVRLMEAFYALVVTEALFKTEQDRIADELAATEQIQARLTAETAEQSDSQAQVLELARSLDLADAFLHSSEQIQRYLTRACFKQISLDDHGTLRPSGHGRHHHIVITYALLLLAPPVDRSSTPAETSPDRTVSLDTPSSEATDRSDEPAA